MKNSARKFCKMNGSNLSWSRFRLQSPCAKLIATALERGLQDRILRRPYKFETIIHFFFDVQKSGRLFQICMSFSEYLNFINMLTQSCKYERGSPKPVCPPLPHQNVLEGHHTMEAEALHREKALLGHCAR